MNEVMLLDNEEIKFDITFLDKKINDTDTYKKTKLEKTAKFNDFYDVEIDESTVCKADKFDYMIATSSGLLTAALDTLWRGEFSLEKSKKISDKQISMFVSKVARTNGYKGESLEGAIKHLEKKYKIPSDQLTPEFGGGLEHHLRDFSHHPSLIGFMCSILSQFTKVGYGTDTNGDFMTCNFEDDNYIGESVTEKICLGTITWAFHLISDMAGSSGYAGEGTGIPGPILSLFKELSVLPKIKEFTLKYKDDDIALSKFISKLFNGTYFKREGEIKGIRFDSRTEFGIYTEISKQSFPVLLNECIVRAFYFIRRLFITWSHNKGKLKFTDYKNVLPYKNRVLSRMLLVSSATFITVTTASGVAKSMIKNKVNKDAILKDFLLTMNYVGVGRFVFAVKSDSKYLSEDFKDACNEFKKRVNDKKKEEQFVHINSLLLNEEQARILYSLEMDLIKHDISITKKEIEKDDKRLWLNEWRSLIFRELSIQNEKYFIESKENLLSSIKAELSKSKNEWLDLISLELSIFYPYYQLGVDNSKKYKKLKYNNEYLYKEYLDVQNEVCRTDIELMNKMYNNYINVLRGRTKKIVGAIATTTAITVASGGLAWAFAPHIAIFIAGNSVVGLSGAALTSASLALVGGGSLAVGGLGMAGGTAIIVGGGALLGAIGAGTISQSTMILLSSSENTLKECAKLLTYCDSILKNKYKSYKDIVDIQLQMENTIQNINEYKITLKEDEIDDKKQKDLFKAIRKTIKHLNKCNKQLLKIIEKKQLFNK